MDAGRYAGTRAQTVLGEVFAFGTEMTSQTQRLLWCRAAWRQLDTAISLIDRSCSAHVQDMHRALELRASVPLQAQKKLVESPGDLSQSWHYERNTVQAAMLSSRHGSLPFVAG